MKRATSGLLAIILLLVVFPSFAGWYDVMHISQIVNNTPYNVTVTNNEAKYSAFIAPYGSTHTDVNKMWGPWYMKGREEKNFIYIDFNDSTYPAPGQARLRLSDHGSFLVAGMRLADANDRFLINTTLDRGGTYALILNYLGDHMVNGQRVGVEFDLLQASLASKIVTAVVSMADRILKGLASTATSLVQNMAKPIKDLVMRDQLTVKNDPHKNQVAQVREGALVGEDETRFNQAREEVVREGLRQFLGLDDPAVRKPIHIGVALSGGGWRAQSVSAGFMAGAAEIGLLDTFHVVSGLSGSTWFLNPWLITAQDPREFSRQLVPKLVQGLPADIGLKLAGSDIKAITDDILVKFAFDQPVNPVDFYGAIIANNLLQHFGENKQRQHISDTATIIDSGRWPLVVNTMALGMREHENYWFEVTPFQVGSRYLGNKGGFYVPTWAFGRQFSGGWSTDFAPEQSMGWYLGVFGSAFTAHLNDAYEQVISKMNIPDFVKSMLLLTARSEAGRVRLFWGEAFNYMKGMEGSPLQHENKLELVDAGLNFIIPTFATYHKTKSPTTSELDGDGAPDILILVDAGGGSRSGELFQEARFAEQKGHSFPIKTSDFVQDTSGNWFFRDHGIQQSINSRAITVFKDTRNPQVPWVLYLPALVDKTLDKDYAALDPSAKTGLTTFDIDTCIAKEFCGTFNLTYTPAQADTLIELGRQNVMVLENQLQDILRERQLLNH